MKEVLLIDPSDSFRDFITDQLTQQQVNTTIAYGDRDSFSKILTGNPNLIIIEAQNGLEDLQDFFKQKLLDPNARSIPIIICGPLIDQKRIVTLTQFGVIKYFTRPIKYDVFFGEISKALNQKFFIDDTKCSIEVHVHNDIVFIELANGLNREKIGILKYKLSEIFYRNNIKHPKIVLLISNIELNFMDAPNIEYLMDNILSDSRVEPANVKILSFNTFVKQLIRGHQQYENIQVTNDISKILNDFMYDIGDDQISDIVGTTLLKPNGNSRVGDFSMHFYKEVTKLKKDNSAPDTNIKIAIVDSDINTCKTLYRTFNAINAETTLFTNGNAFFTQIKNGMFDIIIMELTLSDTNGLLLLKGLQQKRIETPVIIYTSVTRKEFIIQSLALGAKTFLLKPQRSDVITAKIMDLINE